MKAEDKYDSEGCGVLLLTENSMFFLSWLTALGSGTGSVCLMMDTDSPKEKIVRENCRELDL